MEIITFERGVDRVIRDNNFYKNVIVFGFLALVLILSSCESKDYEDNIDKLSHFIEDNMRSDLGGIYTNYIDSENEGAITKGHDILSESIGLDLQISIAEKNKEKFDDVVEYIREYWLDENNIVYWRLDEKTGERGNVNASIDDLRIIRALLDGYKLWGDEEYLSLSKNMERGISNYNLWDSYILDHNGANLVISLFYQDFKTMNYLEDYNIFWKEIKENSLDIVQNGYIGDEFPFYYSSYDLQKSNYIKKDEINMIETLVTVFHLSEVNRVKDETMKWLKDSIEKGPIYSHYRNGDWVAITQRESTAVYALIARIANNEGDKELRVLAIDRMKQFQIQEDRHVLNGAFGDRETAEIYSFDLLQAMLAYLGG
ncbi:MAG: glycosyl hydrolase family 8 [Tissierellales bacterium]|jgi:hypothetical protein|nr:glycosyl hydrolase family 8 [Tissierellales bacterium]